MPTIAIPPKQRIWILGAGSIGCLWAAYLSKANQPVTLILKNQSTKECWLKNNGLVLESNAKNERLINSAEHVNSTELANSMQHGISVTTVKCLATKKQIKTINLLLITTKAHQTLEAVLSIKPQLADNATLVLLQNGLGVYEELAAKLKPDLPRSLFLCASTTEGAYQKSRFHLIHAGRGTTFLGAFESSSNTQSSLEHLQKLLSSTELKVEIDPQIELLLWNKLAINCAINAMTVIHNCQNGKLLSISSAKSMMKSICEEVADVMIKKKIVTGKSSNVAETLLEKVKQVALATEYNYSSMLQDYTNGRSTEINYINGYLVQQAKQLQLQCPSNKYLTEKILHITNR